MLTVDIVGNRRRSRGCAVDAWLAMEMVEKELLCFDNDDDEKSCKRCTLLCCYLVMVVSSYDSCALKIRSEGN